MTWNSLMVQWWEVQYVWFTHRLTTQIAIIKIFAQQTLPFVCANTDNWIWSGVVRRREREKKKGQWSIQTSSDLLDSSLVEGRRFFKPSLSKLFVPGPNREMAPAGNWTQHWIIKSSKRGDIKFHHMWGIKFHHMWIFTFFSGCFGCSFSTSFLLAAGVLYFSLKMSASSSSSANRSMGFLAPTFSRWAVKTRASKQCAPPELQRSLAGMDPHLPGSFWLLPLKKSSSPSSSSNRPPPPTLPPAGTCLTAVGVPSSLLPTESESFRALNRLLSREERIRLVEEGQGREELSALVLKQIPGKTDTAPARIFFPALSESSTEKRDSRFFRLHFHSSDLLDSLHTFLQTVHPTCTLQAFIADFSLFSHRRFWLLREQVTLESTSEGTD